MENSNSSRLAKNTFLLTIRMLFLMAINLYTSRILLNALGVEDYGIYNVVGGIVTMFSVISGSITAAISRFITFELGKGDNKRIQQVFSSAVIIQLLLSFIIFILLETIGLWFLNNYMNIPENRINASNWVFQFSTITFIINLVSVPYNAAIIAHEKMSAFAYVSLYEGISKLLITFLILVSPIDTLVFYALALCLLSISVRFIYGFYCKRNFDECILIKEWNASLIRKMFGFAGWNFIGAASGILRDQGGNIIINIFCGPTANAARGIAYQVNNAVQSFLSSFTTSLNPQITKSYAQGNTEYMMKIIFNGSKFSFYIIFMLSLPIFIKTEYIVNLWLGQSPEHTINFIRLVLILTMSESISIPLVTAMLSTGNIKRYQIIVGGLNTLNLPISGIALWYGCRPEAVFIIAITISQLCLYARLYLLRGMINLNAKKFINKVLCRLLIVSFVSSVFPIVISKYFMDNSFIHFLLLSSICLCISSSAIWFIGVNKSDRGVIVEKIAKIKKRF